MIGRIELHFRDSTCARHILEQGPDRSRIESGGITLSTRREAIEGGAIVRATVFNQNQDAIHLDSIQFDLATGFSDSRPARFFKHGYQSWSASGPVPVGARLHRRDNASALIRIAHQSESTRPHEAPEAATSELFTIVESDAEADRFLAGFIGAAAHLSTITVTTPARVFARALLDGVVLGPGERREIEPLAWWHSDDDAARMAARWADMLGEGMSARRGARYQKGWCSWYHYFHEISEESLIANLRALRQMRSECPLDIVQLDDGYQAALGDWDRTNAKFPSGLKKIADGIRQAGFTAGLWSAPFLAARDSSIMREHEDWFIADVSGGPLRAAYNPNWTTDKDQFAYALDASNPAVVEHLEQLFNTIVGEFGYDYLKLDFLFAAAAEGRRHSANITRAEALRQGLIAIRRGAGEAAFILGCGCPLGPAVGLVDGMRIGPDVAPSWGAAPGEKGEPATALAINAIVARSFMHRRLWLNDPDCVMLRDTQTGLSADERHALALTIAASGGMLLLSDEMGLIDETASELLRAVARIGSEIDAVSITEPPLSTTMMERTGLRVMSTRTAAGSVNLLLNMSEAACEVRLSQLLPPARRLSIIGLREEPAITDFIILAPHCARIVRTR
jgi:alpha-galactosidase